MKSHGFQIPTRDGFSLRPTLSLFNRRLDFLVGLQSIVKANLYPSCESDSGHNLIQQRASVLFYLREILVSYLGPGDWQSSPRIFGSPPPRATPCSSGYCFKPDLEHFLPHPLQFAIYLYDTVYSEILTECLNKPKIYPSLSHALRSPWFY